jgi:hypothetical protein
LLNFGRQGDDYDSSDEEWDQHIGTHARAFLGLNEPVAEIALDEGVGIGQMVRNAFARADDIHTRASDPDSPTDPEPDHVDNDLCEDEELVRTQNMNVGRNEPAVGDSQADHMDGFNPDLELRSNYSASEPDCPSNGDAASQPVDNDMLEDAELVPSQFVHVLRNDGVFGESQANHVRGLADDMEMRSNYSASLGTESSTSGDCFTPNTAGDEEGHAERSTNSDADIFDAAENGGPQEQSSSDEEWDASDSAGSDSEDVEEFLHQIPPGRMGGNPEIDIAATLPLYEGSTLSMLCATLLILNCCKTHSVSNMFVNELLMLLSMSILPVGNCLPKSEYEANKLLRKLGLAYNMIHACPKGCCLFNGDLEDYEQCPVCESERYRMCGRSRIPSMILRHFPLIPQLQRMFSSKKLSKLNMWHHFHKSQDGKMRHTADSPQWNFVHSELEPEAGDNMFGKDPRDIHLGLALDGMNPYSEKRSTLSLTPVIMFNYNLPPWMVTKKYFVMLCLLIPTKLSLTGSNFDVFLQPLVDELQQLWNQAGILTRDARAYMGMSHFKLRAALMWTLHDFPAYGLISGLTTKGFKGCPVCGPHTTSWRSAILRKNVYCKCHRRYLRVDHYFRGADAAFDNEANAEIEEPPLTGNQTIRRGRQSEAYIDSGGTEKDNEYPAKEHGVKRVSALYQLPYWRVSAMNITP